MNNKRLIILHDYLQHKGGGERLVLTLARALRSKLVVGFRSEGAFEPQEFDVEYEELGQVVEYPGFRYLAIQWWFRHRTTWLKKYDAVVFLPIVFRL